MEEFDLYAALGLGRTASAAEIKQAYRGLARDLHPDRNPGDQAAEERFKSVSYAYQVLSDKKKRKLYDEFGHIGLKEGFIAEQARAAQRWNEGFGGQHPFSGGWRSQDIFGGARDIFGGARRRGGQGDPFSVDFESLFSQAYGGKQGQATEVKGQDLQATLSLDFLDAIRGCEKSVTLNIGGETKTIRVRIPAGVADEGSLRLRGQGQSSPYGPPGDLVLKVLVNPHKNLWREDSDLHATLPVTALEAYRGAKVSLDIPSGKVTLRIPKGAQSGSKLRLRGKGITRKGQPPGDLFVHIAIRLPEENKEVEALLEKLEGLYTKSVRG